MGGLRTLLLALAASAAAFPLRAETLRPLDLERIFAGCAGRYSAYTEHLWAVDGPASDEAARRRDLFAQLTEAAGTDPRALGWRVSAKAVQRQLLERATYTTGPRAEQADDLARGALAHCDQLLLGL